MTRTLALAAAVALTVATTASAQQGTAEIRGKVTDQQGAVLPGVAVVVRDQQSGMFRETVTNADGTYFISAVRPGQYEVTAELSGFKKYSRRDALIEVGKTLVLDLQLQVGGVEEQVTVTGESPIVDTTSKEVGGHITSRELVDLPSVNRNFIGFVGLLPGIVPNISTESFGSDSVNVNGQDARNNNYLLDGANNNDDVIGQRAGTQARTPIESIQEFQVITNQFDAEFGRTTGAVINAVTKQGTNRFRGSAFGYFQDASLTKRDYFAEKRDLAKPDTKQQQFGGTLGGPIVRDKAHFFGSLERVMIDRGTTINIPARPEFNTTTTTQDRVWNTLIRFDHQINANNTWGVRWLREQSPQSNQIIGAVTLAAAREEDDTDQTLVGTLSSVFGTAKVNTVRLAFTREDVAFANPCFNGNGQVQMDCDPTLAFNTFTDQQSNTAQARINNAYQIEDTFSWFLPGRKGDHDLKFGVQYQYSSNDFSDQGNMNGTFTFSGNGPYNANDPRSYPDIFQIRVPGASAYYMKAHFFAGFAQDKWQPNSRLTLSLGVRYDLEVVPLNEIDNPEFTDPSQYPVDKNNLAPRLGFSYDLTGNGRTVVRGGYGLFYDKTHFELITGIITGGVYSDSFTARFPTSGRDPGPTNGQFPTNPFLVNGPVVNRALLDQLYPPGSRVKNTGNVNWDNPGRRMPYTHQITLGMERQLRPDMAVMVDYVRAIGGDQFMTKDLNAGLRTTTSRTSPVVRPNPAFLQAVNQPVNLGKTDYDALQVQLEKRFSHDYSYRVGYTLAYSRGNTSGAGIPNSQFQLLDDMRLDLNEGPTNFDRRHNLVISGMMKVPRTGGLTVSGVGRWLSGLPFTLIDANDLDRNGILFDPLPAGTYSGSGDDAYTTDFDGKRAGARGPGFFQLDLRLGYRIGLGGDKLLDVFGDIFNITNRANFDTPTGDRFSTNFLRLTALRPGGIPTTAQLGVRFAF